MNQGGVKNDAVVWLAAVVFVAYVALYAFPFFTPDQVSDIVMPGVSGRELARRFRELNPESRVLFVSGHQVRRGDSKLELGDHEAFMPKPFSLPMLQRQLSGLMSDRVRERVG